MANISETSINRPVLSTVMMLVILLFGFIGYRFLGVREFPSVDQPIISVNVSYPGANADVIMNQITEPLEQNINGIPGIRSLSSVSSHSSSPAASSCAPGCFACRRAAVYSTAASRMPANTRLRAKNSSGQKRW